MLSKTLKQSTQRKDENESSVTQKETTKWKINFETMKKHYRHHGWQSHKKSRIVPLWECAQFHTRWKKWQLGGKQRIWEIEKSSVSAKKALIAQKLKQWDWNLFHWIIINLRKSKSINLFRSFFNFLFLCFNKKFFVVWRLVGSLNLIKFVSNTYFKISI